MKNLKFKEYSTLLCVKINLFTALILFILFICSKLFMENFQNDAFSVVKELDNAAGAMIAIVLVGGLVGILLISCSILVPLIIPLFSNFSDNLKSLIGLVIVNFGIGYFLFSNFTLQLALYYLLPASVGMYFSMYVRYSKRKNTEMPEMDI
ncbi:hypothetical protein DCE79_10125 [Lysinibacillus sp. 2017]|uniref:hypothetical protein n=1 Tax=unclassified Lysinibacillus TaxID=2636778 RepID=UPI000D52A5B8|nr:MULTISPECIES: hypothetical protein [unclassified Lysinibacillus]AWE07719.1 hypothetical protein DCE79_10125 [Lysinibacillus sp. 2017]TGN30764.1 hypothetical protein E4L99_17285 [Lysinibacillus sp. S2017]